MVHEWAQLLVGQDIVFRGSHAPVPPPVPTTLFLRPCTRIDAIGIFAVFDSHYDLHGRYI